jgi:hypothetical protein
MTHVHSCVPENYRTLPVIELHKFQQVILVYSHIFNANVIHLKL